MKEITQYLSEDTSVYATALAAAKADYQHAVSVVAHEFYTQRNGVSIDAQELRALSNVIETAVAHPARFARRLRKLQRYARAIAALLAVPSSVVLLTADPLSMEFLTQWNN